MRHRGLWPVLIALVLPACFDLQKVDPGPRVIDDFNDRSLLPDWKRFQKWTCDTDGGPDGGQPADADGGQSVRCSVEDGGDTDPYALRVDFQLDDPLGVGQQPVAEVVTRTTSGTVDVTGFEFLAFSAYLELAPPPLPQLPTGTLFQVELGCSAIQNDPVAFLTVPYSTFRVKYPDMQFRLSIDLFSTRKPTTQSQTCLAQVDSIHFTVEPQLANGLSTGGVGTLHLDNISLQN